MNTVTSAPATLTVTSPPSTGDNNSGGGGGGASSIYWLAAIAVMLGLRLRRYTR
ncbi:hypothetical protein [Ereboglobus luteus]|uniref:hypothetical protein n=1 Tax=Ereboglobus luteus TaxID=1796921 RepID=UPI00137531D1|nr:hypothetical protein [Ereboglobus luteus]